MQSLFFKKGLENERKCFLNTSETKGLSYAWALIEVWLDVITWSS